MCLRKQGKAEISVKKHSKKKTGNRNLYPGSKAIGHVILTFVTSLVSVLTSGIDGTIRKGHNEKMYEANVIFNFLGKMGH